MKRQLWVSNFIKQKADEEKYSDVNTGHYSMGSKDDTEYKAN